MGRLWRSRPRPKSVRAVRLPGLAITADGRTTLDQGSPAHTPDLQTERAQQPAELMGDSAGLSVDVRPIDAEPLEPLDDGGKTHKPSLQQNEAVQELGEVG